jgi:hypothetical protein
MKEFWMLVGILLSLGVIAGFSSLTPTAAFVANLPPKYDFGTADFLVDSQLSLSLNEAFFDPDGDALAFSVKPAPGVSAGVYGDDLIVLVESGSVNMIEVTASDGRQQTSQIITVRGR